MVGSRKASRREEQDRGDERCGDGVMCLGPAAEAALVRNVVNLES